MVLSLMDIFNRSFVPLSFGMMGIPPENTPSGRDTYEGSVDDFLHQVHSIYRGTISVEELRQEYLSKIRYLTQENDFFPAFLEDSVGLQALADFVLEGVRGFVLSDPVDSDLKFQTTVEFPLFGTEPEVLELSDVRVDRGNGALTSIWTISIRDVITNSEALSKVWIQYLWGHSNPLDKQRLSHIWGDLKSEPEHVFFGWCWRNWTRTHPDWVREFEKSITERFEEFESLMEARRDREFAHHLANFFEHNDAASYSPERLQELVNEARIKNIHRT